MIRVQAPNGDVVQFPEGTDDATINRVMAQEYGPKPEPGIIDRISAAWKGDAAAPEAKTAFDSPEFVEGRRAFRDRAGFFGSLGQAFKELSASTIGDDEDLARALAATVPGSAVENDANGNPMIRLPSGEAVYANRPGMDASDPLKFAGNVAAYLPAARAGQAIGGASLLGRASVTGIASAATNAAGQAAAGREQIDPGEVAITGALGAAGEVAAKAIPAAWSAVRSRLPRNATVEQQAVKLAQEMGLPQPTNAQVRALAGAVDEINAGADPRAVLGQERFGFLYTTGQRLAPNDPRKFDVLAREEVLRQTPAEMVPTIGSAPNAPMAIRGAAQNNQDKLSEAVFRISRELGAGDDVLTPAQAMGRVQQTAQAQAEGLRSRVGAAYDAAAASNRAAVARDAATAIPDRVQAALREFDVNPQLTPATSRTLETMRKSVESLPENVKGVTLRALEQQRRIINNNFGAAANATDRAALSVLRREYDAAIGEAFETALVSGDDAALATLKEARSLRAEVGRRFEGDAQVDSFIIDLVEGNKTPDELVNVALGASNVSNAASARFIERLKLATAEDPGVLGAMRAAHFMKLVQAKTGEPLGMQAIANNIAATERNTGELVRQLYTPEQWRGVKQLAEAVQPLLQRGDFKNMTGGGQGLRGIIQMSMNRLPPAARNLANNWLQFGGDDVFARVRQPVGAGPRPVPAAAAMAGQEEARTNDPRRAQR